MGTEYGSAVKSFKVFGELIEILVSGDETGGLSTTLVQHSPPGGGPPPHSHKNEDETFFVLEGEYEFLQDGVWRRVPQDHAIFGKRGIFHGFRNIGATNGKVLVFVAPAGFERYLEEISFLSPSEDVSRIIAISDRYGITFQQ